MEKLYSPWRSKYANRVKKKTTKKECVFCKQFKEDNDEKNYILKRYKHNLVMLNLYPYNAGHLMIVPFKHVSDLQKLSKEERQELIELTNKSIEVLKKVLKPDGFNVGLNLGNFAGAGIASHLHMHILPRWKGDTNFLPLLAETKQISFDLNEIYKKLKKEFNK